MKFYHYKECVIAGSGQYFGHYANEIIIEAESNEQADKIADSLGMFDEGYGCECCSNQRFYYASEISDKPENLDSIILRNNGTEIDRSRAGARVTDWQGPIDEL